MLIGKTDIFQTVSGFSTTVPMDHAGSWLDGGKKYFVLQMKNLTGPADLIPDALSRLILLNLPLHPFIAVSIPNSQLHKKIPQLLRQRLQDRIVRGQIELFKSKKVLNDFHILILQGNRQVHIKRQRGKLEACHFDLETDDVGFRRPRTGRDEVRHEIDRLKKYFEDVFEGGKVSKRPADIFPPVRKIWTTALLAGGQTPEKVASKLGLNPQDREALKAGRLDLAGPLTFLRLKESLPQLDLRALLVFSKPFLGELFPTTVFPGYIEVRDFQELNRAFVTDLSGKKPPKKREEIERLAGEKGVSPSCLCLRLLAPEAVALFDLRTSQGAKILIRFSRASSSHYAVVERICSSLAGFSPFVNPVAYVPSSQFY